MAASPRTFLATRLLPPDSTPPTIVSAVRTSNQIDVTFSEDMDTGSVPTLASVTARYSNSLRTCVGVSWQSVRVLRCQMSNSGTLNPGTSQWMWTGAGGGIRDVASNLLASPATKVLT